MKCWCVKTTTSMATKSCSYVLGVCLIGLLLGLAGCGRKGPLKPLRPKAPVMVQGAEAGRVAQVAWRRGGV